MGILVAVLLLGGVLWNGLAAAESQCIKCHTDLKGLVKLTLELEKQRPKPVKSAETTGEG